MRRQLRKLGQDERHTFTAKIDRFGTKENWHGYRENTILLVDVAVNNKIVTDHVWFTSGKTWEKFKVNDCITFNARVGEYKTFNRRDGFRFDFCLKRPTKVRKISVT